MACPRCGAEVLGDWRFCGQCAYPLTEEGQRIVAERAQQQALATIVPPLNPNTFAGYLQSDAGKSALQEVMGFLKGWVDEAHRGFRVGLWVFAATLGASLFALVALGVTHTLTSSVATVFGVLIGYVLAKMPGVGGGGGSRSQQ